MLRSIGKQSGESGVSPEEMVGYGGMDLQKKKVLSLEWKSEGVMDDESVYLSVSIYRSAEIGNTF